MRLAPDSERRSPLLVRRSWALALIGALIATLTGVVVESRNGDVDGGAESADAVAQAASRALSEGDLHALLAVADPELVGREAVAKKLVDACQRADFSGARIGVRGGYGDDIAWADLTALRGGAECQQLTLTLSRAGNRWYVALGSNESPDLPPTAATDR